MDILRRTLLRLMTLCVMTGIVLGTLGMSTAPAAQAQQIHPITQDGPVAAPAGHGLGCPAELGEAAGDRAGHGACAMTMCCFVDLQGPAVAYLADMEPAQFGPLAQRRHPDTDPENSDKPPRLT